MCLAVPGKIVKLKGAEARVDFSGMVREVRMDMLPSAKIGDYVIVHAGFALQVLDEKEAHETLKLISELNIPKNSVL